MSTTWILIANASAARLLANFGPKKGLQLVKEFHHPESRERTRELVSDRWGSNQGPVNGFGAFVSSADPKQLEAQHFAAELAEYLEKGRVANRYERLIVSATPQFLGTLNAELSPKVREMVSASLQKDYTKTDSRSLSARLENYIYL